MKNTPNDFETIGQVVMKKLTRYLDESQSGNGKVLSQMPAESLANAMNLERWIQEGGLSPDNVGEFLDVYLKNTQHMHHPGYMGHQVSVPHVASGLADLVHGVVNNPMAIYEMGPAAAVIEKTIVNWMLKKIGWFHSDRLTDFSLSERNGSGVLTHGGSLANLTALLAARADAAPESWSQGVPDDLIVLCPAVSHYSIARSVSIIGLGANAIWPVPVDDLEIMQTEELARVYQQATSQGKRVMAVVANACATATGIYDPIDEIGHFCNENQIWFHVDSAHGASALLSPTHSHRMKGVARADSVIWDTHKMLRTTVLCAAVLFRDKKCQDATFQQQGSYIFHEKEEVGFDVLPNAIECTKSELGTKLFWVLAAEGEQGLAEFVETVYDLARTFFDLFQSHPDFDCPYVPESNILCFQYLKYGPDDDLQLAIRNEIVTNGNFYLTSAEINGKRYLRLTLMNPLTTLATGQSLLDEIVKAAHYHLYVRQQIEAGIADSEAGQLLDTDEMRRRLSDRKRQE